MNSQSNDIIGHVFKYLDLVDMALYSTASKSIHGNAKIKALIGHLVNQLPWRLTLEYQVMWRLTPTCQLPEYNSNPRIVNARSKIGWFTKYEHIEQCIATDSNEVPDRVVVLSGVGGPIAQKILKEYPTGKIKYTVSSHISRNDEIRLPIQFNSYETKDNNSYVADVELGLFKRHRANLCVDDDGNRHMRKLGQGYTMGNYKQSHIKQILSNDKSRWSL